MNEIVALRLRTNEATRWSWMLRAAREDKAWLVERETGPGFASISHRAQDYGLVPHPVIKQLGHSCCDRQVRDLATAASLIRYRYAHRDGIYGMTVMEEVRTR